MLIAIYPLVLAVIGALVFALASNASAKELGRGAYWAGMFALAFVLAHYTVRVG